MVESIYYTLLFLTTLRFMAHGGILGLPIPKPKRLKRARSTKPILIQYPVRNEPKEIIERFLVSLKTIPKRHRPRITIQILDDYDDVMPRIDFSLAPSDIYITYMKRPERTGNKAGNLNYGLKYNKAPYVAIYDSDHQMKGAGLIRAVDILEANPDIACVQSRWSFANKENTLLSWLQEQFLGSHINREQTFRSRFDIYPIFNGAGGVWNRAIVDSVTGGGFPTICVCEDTYLSGTMGNVGYKIHVMPTWTTKVDLVESWDSLQKQQARWIKGNGQQLQHHIRDPRGWGLKKLYWISWNLAFAIAPFKLIVPSVVAYKTYYDLPFNWIEYLALVPHAFAWAASLQTWNNKFVLKDWFKYPLHYITELAILPYQIKGFWIGFFNWNKHIDFDVTNKVGSKHG